MKILQSEERKLVSVIIPNLNGEKYIQNCIDSLARQTYPGGNSEIIVVDNGSRDKSLEIIKQYRVIILQMPPKSTIAALRNAGAKMATGEILAFIDNDCVAPVDWLKEAISFLNASHSCAVGAQYSLPEKTTLVERAWYLQIHKTKIDGETNWLPSCNMILPKDYFMQLGGFREDLVTSEDYDFCQRARKQGLKIISLKKLSVVHLRNAKSVKEFFLKESWRGKGVMQQFFNSLPKIKLNNALLFAFFTFLCLAGLCAGLIIGMVYSKWRLFTISIFALIVPPVFLAVETVKDYKWRYFLLLIYLYFIYGLARATCLFNLGTFSREKKH